MEAKSASKSWSSLRKLESFCSGNTWRYAGFLGIFSLKCHKDFKAWGHSCDEVLREYVGSGHIIEQSFLKENLSGVGKRVVLPNH